MSGKAFGGSFLNLPSAACRWRAAGLVRSERHSGSLIGVVGVLRSHAGIDHWRRLGQRNHARAIHVDAALPVSAQLAPGWLTARVRREHRMARLAVGQYSDTSSVRNTLEIGHEHSVREFGRSPRAP